MTSTSGELAGVFGMLLVQQGSTVTGSLREFELIDGQMDGNVFTATFMPDEEETILSSMTLDGDTLTGTWTEAGSEWSFPVVFHRVSPDPMSPYTGRPRVISASCNGWSIDVTWDRPVSGWDYEVRDEFGQCIVDWSATYNNTYSPDTNTYRIPLHLTTPMVPGSRYTIYLEWPDDEGYIDWHDPYGAPAWDFSDDCYRFDYVHQQLPRTPNLILGYHTSGMPQQWVTVSASWPQEYGLKLYQSADGAAWHNTGLTPTRRGPNGDFTFELWGNAYFRAVTTSGGMESPPSQKVHARPFETEVGGIVVDTPTVGATGVTLAPLVSWHPAWTQSVTLQRYAPKFIDTTTNGQVWSPLTTAVPPQTSLIYGQINGVQGMSATPLVTGRTYSVRVGAFDSENWMFAYSDERRFTTTAESGGADDVNAINALFAALKTTMEAHDLDAMSALFSQDYLHDGSNLAEMRADMSEGINSVASISYNITGISFAGNKASVTVTITVTLDDESSFVIQEPDAGGEGLGMGWLVEENGVWRVYGDQLRGAVELHTVRQPDGQYGLRFQATGPGMVGGTVTGPNINPAPLYWDMPWNDYRQWAIPSQTPNVGDVYSYDLFYGDGRRETITASVRSLVPVCPVLTATPQPDGTISLSWDDVSSQVPGASYYQVSVSDGHGYLWRMDRLGLGTTSFNTPPLMPGTYNCELDIFDNLDNVGASNVNVTIDSGPPPPPPL